MPVLQISHPQTGEGVALRYNDERECRAAIAIIKAFGPQVLMSMLPPLEEIELHNDGAWKAEQSHLHPRLPIEVRYDVDEIVNAITFRG